MRCRLLLLALAWLALPVSAVEKVDMDKDGRYEQAGFWDADGDGSRVVTCYEINNQFEPDPLCTFACQRIYRDFADDLNCMVHGCGFGQLDDVATLYLEPVEYVIWPCWNASMPVDGQGPDNDPKAPDDSLRNTTDVAAYDHCPNRRTEVDLTARTIDLVGSGMLRTTLRDDRDRIPGDWFGGPAIPSRFGRGHVRGIVATNVIVPTERLAEGPPGMIGDKFTIDSLRWLWALQETPYPDKLAQGRTGPWVDVYWSPQTGGAMRLGKDTNDGKTPETPVFSRARAAELFLAQCNGRLIPDAQDECTEENGCWSGWGRMNYLVLPTGCGHPDYEEAHKEVDFWIRPTPGGRMLWDGTGNQDADWWFSWEGGETSYYHMLVERVDAISDGLGSTTPWDSYEYGILTVIGTEPIIAAPVNGTGNAYTAHGLSGTHAYGDCSARYTDPTSTGDNAVIGANGAGTVVVHCGGQFDASLSSGEGNVADFGQTAGATSGRLEEPMQSRPTYGLVTGAQFVVPESGTGLRGVIEVKPAQETIEALPRSNWSEFHGIGLSLTANSTYTTPSFVELYGTDAGAKAKVSLLYTTMRSNASDPRGFHIPAGVVDPTSVIDITGSGLIMEPSGNLAGAQWMRIQDDDWLDSSTSELRLTDVQVGTLGSTRWRISSSPSDCYQDTPSDLESCAEGVRAGAVVFENVSDSVPAAAFGTADGGSVSRLTDSTAQWEVDEWSGAIVTLVSGANDLQARRVVSNTDTELTVTPEFSSAPTNEGYEIAFYSRNSDETCDKENDALCEGYSTAEARNRYKLRFHYTAYTPPFISGIRATGFVSDPFGFDDAGRQPLRAE